MYLPFAFDPPADPFANPLDRDFGNGEFDHRVFQIDDTYESFIENYDTVRAGQNFRLYSARENLSDAAWQAVAAYIIDRLTSEYPDHFRCIRRNDRIELHNAFLNETIEFDAHYRYISGGRHPYEDALDALAAQIPEDLAIVEVNGREDRLTAVHAVAPSGWSPRSKIGKSFLRIHKPVAHHRNYFESVDDHARNLTHQTTTVQRFGWGLVNDTNLDHHQSLGTRGPASKIANPLYIRTERQTLTGFPTASAYLFTIRIHLTNCAALNAEQQTKLLHALDAMSQTEREYKGIAGNFDAIVGDLK